MKRQSGPFLLTSISKWVLLIYLCNTITFNNLVFNQPHTKNVGDIFVCLGLSLTHTQLKMGYLIAIAIATFTIMMMSKIWEIFAILFWRPYAITRHFRKQGVIGPPYSLVSGSLNDIKTMMKDARNMVMDKHSNDITQRVLPHYQIWSSLYGDLFIYLFF